MSLYWFGAARGEWTSCLNRKMTGTGSRSQSTSDDECPQCKNKVAEKKNSVHGNGCLEWWHGTCGGIEVKDSAILAKYSAVH